MLGSYPQCYYNNGLWFGSVVQNSFMITPKWFFNLRKYSFNFLQIQAMFTSNQVINMVTQGAMMMMMVANFTVYPGRRLSIFYILIRYTLVNS